MKIILFSQNPMIKKLLESVSKKLELPMESHERYEELSIHLKENPEWLLIADDECLEKLDQADWLELKEIVSQNKNSVCMYKKGNEAQPFLEGFEMKIKKPFLPTEMLKVLQKKLGFQPSESDPNPTDPLEPAQETLGTNWDELENLGDLEALAKEEPNNEEQLLPTLNNQEEKEEGETQKNEEVPKKLETQEELEVPKEEMQEEIKETPQEQELEAMQELVKEIQENSNSQADKEKTQENAKAFQETQAQELEKQESAETPQENTQKLETQEDHYESIEDIPEPVMAQAMGEELPFLNESVAKTPKNENDTETPKESVIKTPQEKEGSDKASSPLELRLNLQDLLKSLNQESLKSLLENKTLSIKITLEDKKPDA
ncbi:hypothetical protein [Helicobacter pylori]|uniref:hypothetical protein n=1 Tax=Helicobacter pylori TaxID=210 RepID=UPI00165C21A1|nr:hypothetical protein [Helicobacter pylori]